MRARVTMDDRAPVFVEERAYHALDDAVRAAWRGLCREASAPNPFYEPAMLEAAFAAFGPAARPVVLLIWREGAGRRVLIGFLPVEMRRTHTGVPAPYAVSWIYPGRGFQQCYHAAPIVRAGEERAVCEALSGWVGQSGKTRMLRFSRMPLDGALFAALEAAGKRIAVVDAAARALADTTGDADAYFARVLSAKKRKELRRQMNRLADHGPVRFETWPETDAAFDAQAAAKWAADFIAMENTGWKAVSGAPLARDPAAAAFFHEAVRAGARDGTLSFLRLVCGEETVAMLVNLRSGDEAFTYKVAYAERFARYSPGVQIMMEATHRFCADPGIARADSCAKQGHETMDWLWSERRAFGAVYLLCDDPFTLLLFRLVRGANIAKQRLQRLRGRLR